MKTLDLLENELQPRDTSQIAKIAVQIASQAASNYRGPQAKRAAEAAANRVHSIMLKTIDDYFKQLNTKEVK